MIYLGECSHRGTVTCVADTLLDSHRGRKAEYCIHLRTLEDPYILPHIGRQALQITALAFCKEDIKYQGGFPGPRNTGDHNELLPGNGQTQIFEVVLTGPFNTDLSLGSGRCNPGGSATGFRDFPRIFFSQILPEEFARIGRNMSGEGLRRTLGDQLPTVLSAPGTEVDDPIRCLNDIHVMFNDKNRIPLLYQFLKCRKEELNILEMQTGGGFVKYE